MVANQERDAKGRIHSSTRRRSMLEMNNVSAGAYHDQVSGEICRPRQGLCKPGFARVMLVGDGYAGGMQRRRKHVGEPSVVDLCFRDERERI